MSDLVVSVNVGCFYFFREIAFLKSGTIEGKKKNFDCGFENFTLQGFNLNCKKGV